LTDVFSHPAWGIVVDANKQIYFSDLETIYKIDSKGKLSIFRAGASGRHVHDLSIDADGNLYGWENVYEPQTEKHLRAIWKMSPAGAYTEIVSLTEYLPTGVSIWRDSGGNTYSVEPWNNEKKETKIIKRTADGKTSVYAGGKYGYLDGRKEKAEFGAITDLVFGKDNAIYLTDENRVRKIDETGNVKTIYSKEITVKNQKSVETSPQLFGLDIDGRNNIFAADFANHRLLKINSDGAVSTFFTSEKDWSPIGAATFGDVVYVLEGRPHTASIHTGNRVLKISSSGESTVIANSEDRNKPVENPKINSVNVFAKTEESNLTASANVNGIKTTATNPLGFYAIIGALSVAFIALIILVKRK
jgi:alpha-tubulin suppressor-like RCC1 family protein